MQKPTLDSEGGISAEELVPALERMGLPAQLQTEPDLLIWSNIENHPFSVYFYNKAMLSDPKEKAEIILFWAGMRLPFSAPQLHKFGTNITQQHPLIKADPRADLLNFKMAIVAKGLKTGGLFYNLQHWVQALKNIDRMIEPHLPTAATKGNA